MRTLRLLSPLAVLALAACGVPDVDVAPEPDIDMVSDEQLALSLSVARAPGGQKGLHGRFGVGDSRFIFETRRVSEAEEHEMQEAGGVPVSVRITDGSGATVVLSVASHEIPAGWEETVEPGALSDEALDRRAKVARAVSRLAPIIAAAQLPEGSEHDRKALLNASGMVPTEFVSSEASVGDVSQSSTAMATTYKQLFAVWRKPLSAGIAEHSASRWKNYYYSNGAWRYYNTVQYCNHGACPGDSSMNQKCSTWNSGGAYIGSSKSCDSFNSGYLVCGLWGHNHNCHDDTATQRSRVVYRSGLSSEPGWCKDSGCSAYAPNCR
jgi:hypothetical protein